MLPSLKIVHPQALSADGTVLQQISNPATKLWIGSCFRASQGVICLYKLLLPCSKFPTRKIHTRGRSCCCNYRKRQLDNTSCAGGGACRRCREGMENQAPPPDRAAAPGFPFPRGSDGTRHPRRMMCCQAVSSCSYSNKISHVYVSFV